MLNHLHIRNFAIIDELEVDFEAGLTVLTGETGAGKSILLDALGLVLGDRADSASVGPSGRRAEITAEFTITAGGAIHRWLQEQDLDEDEACQLRRVIAADGRSRAFVNGRPAPLTTLRDLGEHLVDIHGQHAHQSLRKRDAQRQLLDAHGGHNAARNAVDEHHRTWRNARDRRARLGGDPGQRSERLELLRYQVDELAALDLQPDEIEALDAEQRRLANASRILQGCATGVELLHDNDHSALGLLSRVASELEPLAGEEEALASAAELIEQARIQLAEAATALRTAADRTDLDPTRLQWVEERLAAIHDLARKHRVEPQGLTGQLERLREELEELEHADERAGALEAEIAAAADRWQAAAERLSAARQTAATTLADAVTREMQTLGMNGGRFAVELQAESVDEPRRDGRDRIELRVAANLGQAPAPLHKAASGGELSRISLAIQMIASAGADIPTQIFDEVDAGIGGRTAAIVGAKLRALASQRQVLCVTHLPQVAACGHHHLRVAKVEREAHVETALTPLHDAARVEEIARMLGGERITQQSRAHAREMLAGEDRTTGPP